MSRFRVHVAVRRHTCTHVPSEQSQLYACSHSPHIYMYMYMIDTEQNVANVVWHMVHENGDKSVVVSSGGKACIDYTCMRVHVHES